jgi:hypothetical protein
LINKGRKKDHQVKKYLKFSSLSWTSVAIALIKVNILGQVFPSSYATSFIPLTFAANFFIFMIGRLTKIKVYLIVTRGREREREIGNAA